MHCPGKGPGLAGSCLFILWQLRRNDHARRFRSLLGLWSGFASGGFLLADVIPPTTLNFLKMLWDVWKIVKK